MEFLASIILILGLDKCRKNDEECLVVDFAC